MDPGDAVPAAAGARDPRVLRAHERRARDRRCSALFGDSGRSARRIVRWPAGNLPQRARARCAAQVRARSICLAVQRPRHRVSRAPGLRARYGRAVRRHPVHGALRSRRERRDVHARHGLRLPQRRLHHLFVGSRRDRRAGRGESGRVLRVQGRAAFRPRADPAAHARRESHQDDLWSPGRRRARHDCRRCAGRSPALLAHGPGPHRAREAGPDHRGALRVPDGHRVGQGRRDRQDLHPAGAARDGAEPRRTHRAALRAQEEIEGARERPLDRPAHRRGSRAHHPRRQGDDARAKRRRAGRRHDRSRLGAGDEARRRDRHEPRRPHLSRGDHRARARHPGSRRLQRRDRNDPRGHGNHGLLRRRRHRLRLRGRVAVRAEDPGARRAAADPDQDHDERRQPRPGVRLRRHSAPGRRPGPPGVHHQSHDRRAPARAAGVRPAAAGAAADDPAPDERLRRSGVVLHREAVRGHRARSQPRSRPSR